jgi:type I restriction enzyme S subunit
MAGNWRETTLGDVIELKRGYDLPQKERKPGNVPLVSSSGVSDKHAVAMVKGPGVVTGRYGTIGEVFFIEDDFWPLNTTLYVRDFKGNDPRFISYFLRGINFHAYTDKAAVPGVNRNDLHLAEIVFPSDIEEQRAIAHILGALDDKIDLNHRRNETLEAMARALFKSWFVDFDLPAPATGGQAGGMAQEDMQESELGVIPKGWRVGTLGDVAEHPRRNIKPAEIKASTPYIALEHMPRCSIALNEWGVSDELESNKYEFRKGEILFGKLRPYFHKVGIAPLDGVCSTDIVVIVPKAPTWFGFVVAIASSDEFVEYTNAGSTGTKMPRTNWSEMARYKIALPPESLAAEFNAQIQPMITKIIASIHQSRTLATLRDTLLSKLLSGELRVKEAENAMKETA